MRCTLGERSGERGTVGEVIVLAARQIGPVPTSGSIESWRSLHFADGLQVHVDGVVVRDQIESNLLFDSLYPRL